jgi:predicted nucleic acid-binding protein
LSIFIDTGVFFAYYSLRDRYHWDAVGILAHSVEGTWGQAFASDLVVGEALTLLKAKLPRLYVQRFLATVRSAMMPTLLHLDPPAFERALSLFTEELDRTGLSFTDASTLHSVRDQAIPTLATFDARTFHGVGVELVGAGYWTSLQASEQARLRRLVFRGQTAVSRPD